MQLLVQPYSEQPLGEMLKQSFNNGKYKKFTGAVAFVKKSGVKHIEKELNSFISDGNEFRLIAGIDHQGTSIEGLDRLIKAVDGKGEIIINHSKENYITFHPKLYLFENDNNALLIIGSGNLTQGGLYTNDEALLIKQLDLEEQLDKELLDQLHQYFDLLSDINSGNAKVLTSDLIKQLTGLNLILNESDIQSFTRQNSSSKKKSDRGQLEDYPFKTSVLKRSAPRYSAGKQKHKELTDMEEESSNIPKGFVMTLQKTDVGTGQTTLGTSRRSPEIFIPLTARNSYPKFWGWKDKFIEDKDRDGKYDRIGVKMRLGGEIISVNMMTWPVKHDFRLRSESLRSAGNIGDLFRIEETLNSEEFEYYVEIIPKNTLEFDKYLSLCTNKTRNSKRIWGYYA